MNKEFQILTSETSVYNQLMEIAKANLNKNSYQKTDSTGAIIDDNSYYEAGRKHVGPRDSKVYCVNEKIHRVVDWKDWSGSPFYVRSYSNYMNEDYELPKPIKLEVRY